LVVVSAVNPAQCCTAKSSGRAASGGISADVSAARCANAGAECRFKRFDQRGS
jgi:hypothetical protein